MTDTKKLAADLRSKDVKLTTEMVLQAADALDTCADAQGKPAGWRYLTPGGLINMGLGPPPDNYDRAHLTLLYAAPPPQSVSRDKLREALRNNHSPDVSPEDIVEMALRTLGIGVK